MINTNSRIHQKITKSVPGLVKLLRKLIASRGSGMIQCQCRTWRINCFNLTPEIRGFDPQKPMSHNLATCRGSTKYD